MALKSVAIIVLSFVAVFVHQCSGRDKFYAIVEAGLGVENSPPAPLFMINTVTQGVYAHYVTICVSHGELVRVSVFSPS